MPHYRPRAGHAPVLPAVLVLAFTMGCGSEQETGTTPTKAASAPATPSPTATPNGVEKLRSAEILTRARKATAAARFVRMRGDFEDGGQRFALDFRYAGKTKATGWFQQGSQRVGITRVGKTVYLKGNAAFWKAIGGKGAVQLFSGKHLKTTTKNPDFKDIAAFTDRTSLLTEAVKAVGTWKKGEAGKVGGTPTVILTGSTGDRLQVAAQGRPYVLLLEGGPGNRLEWVGYEEPVDVQRPPANTVVDADALN